MQVERLDNDLLSIIDLAKYLGGISERTVERMIDDRLCPRPLILTSQRMWRWGTIKRWLEAVEFLQQNNLLLPPGKEGKEDKKRQSDDS